MGIKGTRKFVSKEVAQDADQYLGRKGEVWFQEGTSQIRFGDNVTVGGQLLATGSSNSLTDSGNNQLVWNSSTLIWPDTSVQTTAFTGNAVSVDIMNTNGLSTPYYLTFVENRTSAQTVRADVDLTYRTDTNTLALGNMQVQNTLRIGSGVLERWHPLSDATGVVVHDCSLGHIFYHTSVDANWTVNLINFNLDDSHATSITLVISQGATGYIPNELQIAGVAQTILWQNNQVPTASVNRVDVVTFSILNSAGTYTVLGQLTGF
jgi:hypothetical protein